MKIPGNHEKPLLKIECLWHNHTGEEMKKILFVGLNPFATAGNSAMMNAVISHVDMSRYSVSCYAADPPTVEWMSLLYNPLPYSIIPANDGLSFQSMNRMYQVIMHGNHDAVVFIGMDIWEYLEVLRRLNEVPNKPFKIAALFPYDLQDVRNDWVDWINNFTDFPCVYSQYGENILKDHVLNIRYFRPPLKNSEAWQPLDQQAKMKVRNKLFPTLRSNDLVFGFIGRNQKRKDPQGLIEAFAIAHKECPNLYLFMHTDFNGKYNLVQFIKDCGVPPTSIMKKNDGHRYLSESMPKLYNAFDAVVNCTIQEGLSWTPLEAMLCGVPVIASDTTAHPELIKDAGILVPCNTKTTIRMGTETGPGHVQAKKCDPKDIAKAIIALAKDKSLRDILSEKGIEKARAWLDGVDDINELLDEMCKKNKIISSDVVIKKPHVIDAILFAQHSSAGDVFMTTRCFKGLKKRYGLPLHYMTSKQYMDIVVNNPHVDRIIPWDEYLYEKIDGGCNYRVIVNPHDEKIGPGHWGRNSNALLSDFYWKILDLEPDDFFIELKQPEAFFEKNKDIAILHTTGGDPQFRTYKFMKDVHEGLADNYTTVQLGGANDFPAWADVDLRGKLTFRETAWVMSKASVAVTVDSFISHLAGALGVSQVCLFGTGNSNVVRPNQVKGKLICRLIDYVRRCPGLGPCSAAVRDCPHPCTGMHDPKDILKDMEELDGNGVVMKILGGVE